MANKGGGVGGALAVVIAVGGGLHKLHDAVDGYEWLASLCPYCRLRGA
jgi:hypothetical protein